MKVPWRKHIPFLLILAAFLVLSIGHSVINPLYESPDEVGHYRFVEFLRLFHSLPTPNENGVRLQAHHPPLFYAAAALVSAWVPRDHPWDYEPEFNPHWAFRYAETGTDNKNQFMHHADEDWPYRGTALAVHMIRWFNVLLGALTVWLAYRLARAIFPSRPALALGATAFVAFNPMFQHLSGGVTNDIAAALTGTTTMLICVQILAQDGPLPNQRLAWLGGVLGIALLTKAHLLALVPVTEITLMVAARRARSWQLWLRANLIVFGLAGLISGWWYARNLIKYGDLTGVRAVLKEWGGERVSSESAVLALGETRYLWTSLWGRFDYGQIPLPEWQYIALLILVIAGVAGLIPAWLRTHRRGDGLAHTQLAQLALCALTAFLFFGAVFYYMLLHTQAAMGRFLFPALASFGALMVWGLSGWLPRRWEGALAAVVNIALLALCVYSLFGIVQPAYARPAPLTQSQIASIPHPAQAVFSDQLRLLGYAVNTDQLQPGDEFILTAYWQVLSPSVHDLTIFVHLVRPDGMLIVAQRDTYPGLGRFPASAWQPGDTFSDRYRIVLDPNTCAPDVLNVSLGLYVPGGERLPLTSGGSGNSLTLLPVSIRPHPGTLPNPVNIDFDHKLTLAGYDLSSRSVQAGQALTLTLYWKIPQPVQYDYNVFAHILGDEYRLWATDDGLPRAQPKRTRQWVAGQIYTDTRVLTLAPDTPPGTYPIEFGVYGGPNGDRLSVWDKSNQLDDWVFLTQVLVK